MLLPVALILLALALPAQSHASVLDVQRDCADSDTLERKHSRADLQAALDQIQADLAEYSDCRKMVLAALAAMKSDKGGSGAGGGGAGGGANADLNGDGVVTPAEKRIAVKRAERRRQEGNDEIAAIRDDLVHDDAATVAGGGDDGPAEGSSLALILALAALLGAGVGGGVWYASKRNPAVANALRRVPLPFRNS